MGVNDVSTLEIFLAEIAGKSELREAYFKLFKDGTEEEFEHYYKIISKTSNQK